MRRTAIERRLPQTLSSDAGQATPARPSRAGYGAAGAAHLETSRDAIRKFRREIGDGAGNPKYILSKRRAGFRLPGPEDG